MAATLKHFYVSQPLAAGVTVATPGALQRRLSQVLRLPVGAQLALFNGQDGLFTAQVASKDARTLDVQAPLKAQPQAGGSVLVLGLPKREAWESALRQATELNVAAIQPIVTQFAQRDKINAVRAQALMIEAAEQCERLSLPELRPLQPFAAWLEGLSQPCAWAYERLEQPAKPTTASQVLVGPEGGFSPQEVQALQAHRLIETMGLGPTILRTDTAVVAGLVRLKA
jgi:16S rRNA (uracil1498-N3)-methyltransferase